MSRRRPVRLPRVHPHQLEAEPPDDSTLSVRVRSPVRAGDAEQVCRRVGTHLAGGRVAELVCHVEGVADLGVVEVLVRLELLARRAGARLRVRSAGTGLDELLRLAGLSDAVGR